MAKVNINLPSISPLLDQLKFQPEDGKIWLAEQRSVLMGLGALSSFRKEIITTLGQERGKGFFMRLGYMMGMKDAELARSLGSKNDFEEQFLFGPLLHNLRGMVKVRPLTLEYDPKKNYFYAEFEWINSFEVEICRTALGQLNEPACWILLGYACAYTSHFAGMDIQYREVLCCGQGDNKCKIIGKKASEWPDYKEFNQLFLEAPLIDELYELQSRIADLEQTLTFIPPSVYGALGEAPPFTSALALIDKGAPSEVTMLLLGETGTGKEVLARRIHSLSARNEKPFVAVNCAAIPPELVESELFGVEKGAYTGATQSRVGRFERANEGTIFLDEIIELSARAQAALLRTLQEGEIERVGDNKTRKVDVRVIAATNEDLEQAVKEGRFRQDLFYRINAYVINIPPLRNRKNDIILLAEHFRKRYEKQYKKTTLGFSDLAIDALNNYDWPGNIRELENTIERGIILTDNQESITELNLFSSGKNAFGKNHYSLNTTSGNFEPMSLSDSFEADLADQIISHNISLEELESSVLNKALELAKGNISEAARTLGLTRAAFDYRLKKQQPKS